MRITVSQYYYLEDKKFKAQKVHSLTVNQSDSNQFETF